MREKLHTLWCEWQENIVKQTMQVEADLTVQLERRIALADVADSNLDIDGLYRHLKALDAINSGFEYFNEIILKLGDYTL